MTFPGATAGSTRPAGRPGRARMRRGSTGSPGDRTEAGGGDPGAGRDRAVATGLWAGGRAATGADAADAVRRQAAPPARPRRGLSRRRPQPLAAGHGDGAAAESERRPARRRVLPERLELPGGRRADPVRERPLEAARRQALRDRHEPERAWALDAAAGALQRPAGLVQPA